MLPRISDKTWIALWDPRSDDPGPGFTAVPSRYGFPMKSYTSALPRIISLYIMVRLLAITWRGSLLPVTPRSTRALRLSGFRFALYRADLSSRNMGRIVIPFGLSQFQKGRANVGSPINFPRILS